MRRSDESEAKRHQSANLILSKTKLARSFLLWVVSRVYSSSLSRNLLLLLLCNRSDICLSTASELPWRLIDGDLHALFIENRRSVIQTATLCFDSQHAMKLLDTIVYCK